MVGWVGGGCGCGVGVGVGVGVGWVWGGGGGGWGGGGGGVGGGGGYLTNPVVGRGVILQTQFLMPVAFGVAMVKVFRSLL